MNKNDIKLVIILLIFVLSIFGIMFLFRSKNEKKALVYYEDKLVLTIDLSLPGEEIYEVDGQLGKVTIQKTDEQIRVKEENSPNHICSRQGYISESYEVLVCLPNKVVIKIEDKEQVDTVVK